MTQAYLLGFLLVSSRNSSVLPHADMVSQSATDVDETINRFSYCKEDPSDIKNTEFCFPDETNETHFS